MSICRQSVGIVQNFGGLAGRACPAHWMPQLVEVFQAPEPALPGVLPHHAGHRLGAHPVATDVSALVDTPEDAPLLDAGLPHLLADGSLRPGGHRHRTRAVAIAHRVADDPSGFPLLNVGEHQGRQLQSSWASSRSRGGVYRIL
jgi:hypothetical protein